MLTRRVPLCSKNVPVLLTEKAQYPSSRASLVSINQAAPDLALIAQSAMLQLEASLVLSCLEDPDGSAAIAQAMTDGILQLFLVLGPLRLSALDLESAAALAKS